MLSYKRTTLHLNEQQVGDIQLLWIWKYHNIYTVYHRVLVDHRVLGWKANVLSLQTNDEISLVWSCIVMFSERTDTGGWEVIPQPNMPWHNHHPCTCSKVHTSCLNFASFGETRYRKWKGIIHFLFNFQLIMVIIL